MYSCTLDRIPEQHILAYKLCKRSFTDSTVAVDTKFKTAYIYSYLGRSCRPKTQWRGLVLNLSHVGSSLFWPVNIQTISKIILLWTHNWYLKFCSSVSCTKRVWRKGTDCFHTTFFPPISGALQASTCISSENFLSNELPGRLPMRSRSTFFSGLKITKKGLLWKL